MFIQWMDWCFPIVLSFLVFEISKVSSKSVVPLRSFGISNSSTNTFQFQNLKQCRENEFYDLNYFACAPCNEAETDSSDTGKLQPSADKFSCQCFNPSFASSYGQGKIHPSCVKICPSSTETENCTIPWPQLSTLNCSYLYVNSTNAMQSQHLGNSILLTRMNGGDQNESDCNSCNLAYNFHYQGYCIANALLRPYLHYNAFWQSTSTAASIVNDGHHLHFGELKFVAFFCLTLRNASACNQLANACVLSHYSLDKHSPCSAFLLTQVSDVVMKYANAGEQLRAVQPFLFYKKGRETIKMLSTVIDQTPYKLTSTLDLFSTTYSLAGNLKRWGTFSWQQVNLCQLIGGSNGTTWTQLRFAQRQPDVVCQLSLEQIIDVATLQNNDNFFTIYLNYTKAETLEAHLMAIPILIETLTAENQRSQREEWQLVKRFQLIETHPRSKHQTSPIPNYEDAHKMQLYRSIRYVEHIELHYNIHSNNRISVPLLKLRYRHIQLSTNSSLQQLYPFAMHLTFQSIEESTRRLLLVEVVLPFFMLCALIAALVRIANLRRRRAPGTDLCEGSCIVELLVQLSTNLAMALLTTALLLLLSSTLQFATQRRVNITLPLLKSEHLLEVLIYVGCVLQFVFLVVHLRRASRLELFLIDWERPRSGDHNHFNLKSNLDTSSVCSSVRTYVAESNVSAWRVLFTTNEWIRLSVSQKYSTMLQAIAIVTVYQLFDRPHITHNDVGLRCCLFAISYLSAYFIQLLVRQLFIDRITGEPLKKFVDLCSLANVSFFSLLDPGFGYYIHGRSPHGFADTDMSSMLIQLQRESQNMCGRRGLLMDSDHQCYIILPPRNLRIYLERLLLPFQRSCSVSQSFYQKELPTIDGGGAERTSIAYASINRFFCAFIDHVIKDMDYIIKEKTFLEKFLNCEIDNYLTENKGTFYIDENYSFGRVLLLGNHGNICILEILLLMSTFLLTKSILIAIAVTCSFNMLMQRVFRYWVRANVSRKTLIDERFLL